MDFIFHTQEQDFHNKINYLLDEIDDYYVTSPPAKADDEQPGMPIFPKFFEVLPEKGKLAKSKILAVNRSKCTLIDLPPQIVAFAQEYLVHGVSLTCAILKRFLGNMIGSQFASEGHMNTTKSN